MGEDGVGGIKRMKRNWKEERVLMWNADKNKGVYMRGGEGIRLRKCRHWRS